MIYLAIEDVVHRLAEFKSKGFVPTMRKGPTGIGHTLEQMLDLEENNLAFPDLGEVELKTTRSNTQSLITLFTYDRGVWKEPLQHVIERLGIEEEDRTKLYATVGTAANSFGLSVNPSSEYVELRGPTNEVLAQWDYKELQSRFHAKLRHVLLVHANSKQINNVEHFHYYRAQFLSGWLFLWNLPRLFNEQIIWIDLRMHLSNAKVRNHGTAFRIREQDLTELYPLVEEMPV